MLSLRSKSVFLAISVICCGQSFARRAPGLQRDHIKNIVVFGNSYSDIVSVGDNGTAWPVYAAGYGPFNLFPFAKSGATCSNNLTNRPFPSVMESQLPLYFSEIENGMLRLDPSETVYSLWIGTNDIGQSALLTGDQTPGVRLVDVIECATNWVNILFESGARNFLFQNMIPLENTVLYSKDSYPDQFRTFERNSTEWSILMTELTTSGNALTELILRDLASTLVGAQIGLFDSHALFSDIIYNPAKYLNGTAPLNVVNPVKSCVFESNGSTPNCTLVTGADRDSYLWFDELHPSEQVNRIVARAYADAVLRKSDSWVTWLG